MSFHEPIKEKRSLGTLCKLSKTKRISPDLNWADKNTDMIEQQTIPHRRLKSFRRVIAERDLATTAIQDDLGHKSTGGMT
jgi:hypothetical protein